MTYVTGPVRRHSNKALASIILGFVGVALFWLVIPQILAVVYGHQALKEIREQQLDGTAMAIVGLVLGYAFLVLAVLVFVTVF